MPAAGSARAPPAWAGAETVHCWQRTGRARRESIARARQRDPAAAYSGAKNVTRQWRTCIAADRHEPFPRLVPPRRWPLPSPAAATARPCRWPPAPARGRSCRRRTRPSCRRSTSRPAKGWPAGDKPVAAPGLVVTAYATGLDHPRWLTVLPNGDVLVAETNAPPKPEDGKGVKGWLMKQFMKRAGAGTPSAEPDHPAARRRRRRQRRDARRLPREPALAVRHGAGRQRLLRRQHRRRSSASRTSRARRRIDAAPTNVAALPGGPINHHWTKNVIASNDGARLYATVGSNSNVGENGMAAEEGRAAIWEIDATQRPGTRLRERPAQPERHGLGQRRHAVDGRQRARRAGQRPGARLPHLGDATAPSTAGRTATTASTSTTASSRSGPSSSPRRCRPTTRSARTRRRSGWSSSAGSTLPAPFSGEGMFVGQHGSWNRKPLQRLPRRSSCRSRTAGRRASRSRC